jgi:serine/threonine protein kinase
LVSSSFPPILSLLSLPTTNSWTLSLLLDIKGANLLVDNNGNVKLADFGASKRLKNIIPGGSAEKSLKGTVYWMAPEVIKQKGHGRQADIWSVGCTVIEMATGKPPWSDITDQIAAMYHIASSNKPPSLPSGLSNEGKDFLQKCLKIEYRKRPSAAQLLEHVWIARGAAFPPRLSEDYARRPRSNNLPKVGTATSTPGGSEMPRKARSFQQEPLR